MKIGIGIITCNREHFFKKCINSIRQTDLHSIVVVNDGRELEYVPTGVKVIQNKSSLSVGICKNIAMQYLLDQGCDYIFTLEDDILIKDSETFKHYINTSIDTGIEHFNFGFSQKENLDFNLNPVYKKIIEYKNSKIVLTQNILGAFTFYTRNCLQHIGLHHKGFNKGHGDHPELTYRAFKHGFTTPFWWFADVYGSWDMIVNQSNMGDDSLVRNQEKFWSNFKEACSLFGELHGYDMLKVPVKSEQEVIQILRKIKNENNK